jgi:hypothetical protein
MKVLAHIFTPTGAIRAWASILMLILGFGLALGLTIGYVNKVDKAAERRSQERARDFCDVIVLIDDRNRQVPPKLPPNATADQRSSTTFSREVRRRHPRLPDQAGLLRARRDTAASRRRTRRHTARSTASSRRSRRCGHRAAHIWRATRADPTGTGDRLGRRSGRSTSGPAHRSARSRRVPLPSLHGSEVRPGCTSSTTGSVPPASLTSSSTGSASPATPSKRRGTSTRRSRASRTVASGSAPVRSSGLR